MKIAASQQLACHTQPVSHSDWNNLTRIERSFLVNAAEQDILAGTLGDLDEAEQDLPHGRLGEILVGLIDRGWVEVRRYVIGTMPDWKSVMSWVETNSPGFSMTRAPGTTTTTSPVGSVRQSWSSPRQASRSGISRHDCVD
jgi:hypothetical protein